MPLVSVVMPAYNHQPFVRQAVESIQGQSHPDLELIVIDDASQDGTWEILRTFDEPRLRLTRNGTNRGAHASLNEGLSMARGDYVAIINSDDVFHPRRLELLLKAAAEAGGDDFFAFSDVSFIDRGGTSAPAHERARDYWRLCRKCGRLDPELWFLVGNVAVSTSNFFFSRSMLNNTGVFAALRYTHDWNWALRATERVAPVWIRESLLYYRIHESNTLSEADGWRHVHENAYVQAAALQHIAQRLGPGTDGIAKAREVCLALLGNESLHPLPLLCFLAYYLAGADDDRMQGLTCAPEGRWMILETAAAVGCPSELFLSLPHLVEKENVIAGQARLIEERWRAMQHMSGEIASRDSWIAGLRKDAEQLHGEIARRHDQIQVLIADIASKHDALEANYRHLAAVHDELAGTKHELASLYASRLVRWALSLSRRISRLRGLSVRLRHRCN
jgi:glycosyltransferase involved in cell wall biosynthesis